MGALFREKAGFRIPFGDFKAETGGDSLFLSARYPAILLMFSDIRNYSERAFSFVSALCMILGFGVWIIQKNNTTKIP